MLVGRNRVLIPQSVRQWAACHLEQRDFVIVDTETTGVDRRSEVVSVAVVNAWGKVCFSSLVKPLRPIDEEGAAFKVHGITNDMVEHAPSITSIGPALWEFLSGITHRNCILAYNAAFDQRMLECSMKAWDLPMGADETYFPANTWECVMNLYGRYCKEISELSGGVVKLSKACFDMGVSSREWHDSSADALATYDLLCAMAGNPNGK